MSALASVRRGMTRVAAIERRDTAEAADVLGLPAPLDLDDFADSRTRPGPVDMGSYAEPRELVREALEELADCRNYLAWRMRELRSQHAPELEIQRCRFALACVVVAWRATARLTRG